MNNRQIVASLSNIANELDSNGLFKEANEITEVMVKLSQYSGLDPNSSAGRAVGLQPTKSIFERYPVPTPGTAGTRGNSIFDKYPVPAPGTAGTKERGIFEKYPIPKPGTMGTDPLPEPPYDTVPDSPKPENKPNVGNKPGTSSTKPSAPGKPSKPGSSSSKPSEPGKPTSKTPQTAEGLDRWVNKAENIYNAWGQKGANPNSSAFGLVKDIVDYMDKVKSNLPSSLHGQADAKIARVQEMLRNIFDGAYNPALAMTALPYGVMGGYPKKGVDPFGTGQRMQGKALDYQARQEGKSY